jgi:HSP20 family molecular chaperone IbpA
MEFSGFKHEEVKLDINESILQISVESKRDKQYEESHIKISEI